jgi:ABC-2 type transport system ATP-binding protein
VIRVVDLVKSYGPNPAVRGISFEVGPGEVVGFLGPNGAGKTTTIRVLTCFHPATSGTAEVAGRDVFRDSVEVRRRVGYLPENVPLYPEMRVQEYLRFRARIKGVSRRDQAAFVAEAMERCGVADVRRRLVGQISRGYRQRVGLADALVAKPPILILDEPTSGLDPNQRRKVKDLVRELAAEHTILFSSHILAEVEAVSTRILIIHKGIIRADGTPSDLVSKAAEGRRLVLTARADPDALRALVLSLRGVRGAEVAGPAAGPEDQGGFVTVEAVLERGADPRDEAFARASAASLPVRELTLTRASLDDLFHELTSREEDAA